MSSHIQLLHQNKLLLNPPDFIANAVQFEQYQEHHIHDAHAMGGRGRVYDITVYAIAKGY